MDSSSPDFPISNEVQRIGRAIAEAGGRPVLVGGWVRDSLMGHPHIKDFDIEVFALPTRHLQKVLSPFGPLHTVGRHFGVLKLVTRGAEYDISVPRRESKIGKGHKEFDVVADPGMSFEEAAARRDFTINSMGFAFLENRLLDPFQGEADLRRRLLRHTGPAFGEDPLRVLRAMQFAGRFDMSVAEETVRICREQDLSELPQERMWEEFRKLLLQSPMPSIGLRYAEPLGVLPYFPELLALAERHEVNADGERFDAWERTLAVVDAAAARREGDPHKDMVLMLAALTHLFGAPLVAPRAAPHDTAVLAQSAETPLRHFLSRLTREAGLADAVWALVGDLPTPDRLHAHREEKVDTEIRRLALRVRIAFLLRLAAARHAAAQGAEAPYAAGEWLSERARALGVYDEPPTPLLKGRHLLEIGLQPGPEMGRLLDEAFERQLDGAIASLEEAVQWAKTALRARRGP